MNVKYMQCVCNMHACNAVMYVTHSKFVTRAKLRRLYWGHFICRNIVLGRYVSLHTDTEQPG